MIHRLRHTYLGRLFFYYIIAGVLLVLSTVGLILALASASVGGNVRAQTFSGVSAIAAHLDEYLENCREVIRKVAGDGVVARYLARDPGATRYDVARVLHLSDINAGGGFAVHVVRLSDGEISSTGAVSPVFERENYNPEFTMFRRILSAEDVADYKSVRGINMLGDTRLVLGKAVRGEAGEALGLVVVEVSREAFDSVVSGYALPSARSVAVVDPYDVVLFSDVGADTFLLLPDMVRTGVRRPDLLKLTREYVRGGGGFGMIGGYMTFAGFAGAARYASTPIEEILPVSISPYDDRVEVPDGADLFCDPESHSALNGLPAEWPYILGYNRLKAKPDARVLVSFEGDPILALGQYGEGRTMAFAGDCGPHWSPAPFHTWTHYPSLWNNLCLWLAGQ